MLNELTDDHVKNARILAAQGMDPARIARDFGFDPEALFDAVEGVTFRYITQPPRVRCKTLEITNPQGARIAGVQLDGRRLRKIRTERLKLSQGRFALELRQAGAALGVPNRCTKRLVQKWERGLHKMPSPNYQLALAHVIGQSVEAIYQRVLPEVVDDAMEQLAAVLPVFAETYDKLIELNAHLIQQVGEADAEQVVQSRPSARTIVIPQASVLP
jgi:transcriptional regulator with XRE-family HTH domain